MIKGKYKKILIISFVVVFTMMSIMSGIMAGNIFHTDNCTTPNCTLCMIIHFSSDFVKNIGLIALNILIFILVKPLIINILQNIYKNRRLTLVELKVIQLK